MARRTFAFQKRLSPNAGGSILDIPHTAVLRYSDPHELVSTFREQWGVPPAAVVLPVVNPDGLLFPVEGLSEAFSAHAENLGSDIRDLPDAIFKFAQAGLDIYLLIDPSLSFINCDPLQVIDISGDSSRRLCFGNSRTQDIISAILGTALDIALETTKQTPGKVRGIVLDCPSLWPMAGENERLDLSCFCPSCEELLEHVKPGLVRRFKTFPNPWNLVLQASSTGIGHINEIRRHDGPEEIVGLSKQKGYDKAFKDSSHPFLLDQARGALDYIEARHALTLYAAKSIFDQVLEGIDSPPRKVLLVEGMYYSWSGGLHLERLDLPAGADNRPYDELWFDVRSSSLSLKSVDFCAYMCTRSRYYLDAFFDMAAQATNAEARASTGIGRFSTSEMKDKLRQRLSQAMACVMTGQTSLGALQDHKHVDAESKRVGFVGVGLTRDIGEKFIEGLRIAPGFRSEDSASVMNMDVLAKLLAGQGGSS